MSDALAKADSGRRRDLPKQDRLSPHEQNELKLLQRDAKRAGVKLATGGKGGLPPSLVRRVMRRDHFECKKHGDQNECEGGLTVHHKGGVHESKWLRRKDHANDENNLVTLCAKAHDEIHEKAKAEGVDSSQQGGGE